MLLPGAGVGPVAGWGTLGLSPRHTLRSMDRPVSDVYTGVEQSVDGVFVGKPDGAVLYANPAGRQLMGGSVELLTAAGHSGTTIADPTLWQWLFEHRRRTGWLKGIAPVARLDGTVFWAGVTSSMFVGDSGEDLSFWIIRDVTQRVQLRSRLQAYDEISEALLAGWPTTEVLDLMARHACTIFDAAFATIVTPEPNGVGVMIAAAAGEGASDLVGRTYPPGGLSESVMNSPAPRLIEDITAMTRSAEIRDLRLGAGMIVPIVSGGDAIGTLFVGAGSKRPRYGLDDLADAKLYATRVGVALALESARSAAERAQSQLAEQLQVALESRVILEQAKGFIACLRQISTEAAFEQLRRYARSHNMDVHAVAHQIIDRELIL